MTQKKYNIEQDARYLQLLARTFPTIAEASTEIINLRAILNLPKATEHFLADLHGEYEAFQHVLKNASGNIKRKVNDLFGITLRESEKRELCTLIYYPEQKLEVVKLQEKDIKDWYHITIHRLVAVCRNVSSKYTRSKVRKSLPKDFSYIIQELLDERGDDINKVAYINVIIDTIVETGRADAFIIAICHVIQRLAIDHLHILGDIFDRGPGAHKILDFLSDYHQWDITWGNHDIVWMGAAAGNVASICAVLRLCMRYGNLVTLEDGYGINLLPLATFAMDKYAGDPCTEFIPRIMSKSNHLDEKTLQLSAKMHKAIAVILLKVEARLFASHPEWKMEQRILLDKIDYAKGTIRLDGNEYQMSSCHFPTVDPKNPNQLTDDEQLLIDKLVHSFSVCEKLQRHMQLLLNHGSMYGIYNNNLLFHASVPLNDDGTLKEVELIHGTRKSGRDLMNEIGRLIRSAFKSDNALGEKEYAVDYLYYLWCGPDSPLFDKDRMTTFERYFLKEKEVLKEHKGNYYNFRDDEKVCEYIMDSFGVTGENRHIINGHVPVHAGDGESPIKAGGKLMVIDGGFSRAYHKETGIAGYTLVYHSRGFQLVQHEPFTSTRDAIERGTDIKSTIQIVEMSSNRMKVADTDKGVELREQIEDLEELLYAYRHGYISEHDNNNVLPSKTGSL